MCKLLVIIIASLECSLTLCTLQYYETDTRMHWKDIFNFYYEYFSTTKSIEITILTEDETLQMRLWDFCDNFIANIVKTKPSILINVNRKQLNKKLDMESDPVFLKFVNETFILDHNFTLEKPPIIRKRTHLVPQGAINKIRKQSCNTENGHIILTLSLDTLKTFLNGSYHVSVKNRRALHAIFVLNLDTDAAVADILLTFWTKFHILNSVLHFPQVSEDIYIYRPFEKASLSWGVLNVYEIASANGITILNFLENLEGYPLRVKIFVRVPTAVEVIPKNMIGDPVYENLFRYSSGFIGVDGCLLGELARQMNFTVLTVYRKQRNFGKILEQGWITGSLGYIVYDLVDLVANGMFVTDHKTQKFEFTNIYFYDEICIVAPKAEKIPQWLAILKCFHWQTWIFLLCTGGISLTFCYFAYYFQNAKTLDYGLMDVFLILVSAPIKSHNLKERNIFLASCMIFNAVITWIFQGTLVKSFGTASYYADINTLEALDNSELAISTSLHVFDNYNNSTLIKNLYDKIVHKYDISMKQAALERNVVALDRRKDSKLFILLYMTSEGAPRLHISKVSIISYYMSFMVPEGSPFLYKFNVLIISLFENGLVQKWYEDIAFSITANLLFKNGKSNEMQKSFSLHDIQSAFTILVLGFSLSFIVFLHEIIKTGRKK